MNWEIHASDEIPVVSDGVILCHRINRALPVLPHEVVVRLVRVVPVPGSRDLTHRGRVAVRHVVDHGIALTGETKWRSFD